jgi:plasmid stabilization system protein ParE
MSFVIYNRPEANKDIDEAVDWYEQQQTGLGLDFLDELESMLLHLETQPLLFQKRYRNVHQAPMHRFPFVLLYQVEDESTVSLLAVFHTSKNPEKKP